MAVKINLEKKVKFWRFVHHDASSVNIDRMSGDYNQAVQKLIQPRVKVSNDDAIPEEQVSRDYESLYPENYTEVEVAKIRKRAEMIQTVQGMKNLAFDNNILFWFSNHGQQLSDRSLVLNGSRNDGHQLTTPAGANPRPDSPGKSKNLMNFTLQPMATNPTSTAVLVAWAKLDMNGVDSSDAVEAFINSCQQTPSMMSVVSPNKSRNSVNLDASDKVKNPRSANNFKTFESKGKYFLKIHSGHNPEDEIVEVLFFESREKLEEWRGWLAKVPVCFLDLKHRYEFIQHRGRDGPYRIVDVRCRRSGAVRNAKIVDCFSNASNGFICPKLLHQNIERAVAEILLLRRLEDSTFAEKFMDMYLSSGQLWIILTHLEGEKLSDWVSRFNSKPSDDPLVVEVLLEIILGLLHIVKLLAKKSVLHGNIASERVLIKICSCTSCQEGGIGLKIGLASQISQEFSNVQALENYQLDTSKSPRRQNIVIDTSFHRAVIFGLTGFEKATVYPQKFQLKNFEQKKTDNLSLLSMSHNTSYHLKPIKHLKDPLVKRNLCPENEDIFGIGKIIFEILFGLEFSESRIINIQSKSPVLEPGQTSKSIPMKFIQTHLPLYKTHPDLLELLGLMLESDCARRPSVFECIALVSAILEQHKLGPKIKEDLPKKSARVKKNREFSIDPGPVAFKSAGSLEENKGSVSYLINGSPELNQKRELSILSPDSDLKPKRRSSENQDSRQNSSPTDTQTSHLKSPVGKMFPGRTVRKESSPLSLIIRSPDMVNCVGPQLQGPKLRLKDPVTGKKQIEEKKHLRLTATKLTSKFAGVQELYSETRITDLGGEEASLIQTNLTASVFVQQQTATIKNPFKNCSNARALGACMKPSSERVYPHKQPDVDAPVE